MLIKYFEYIVIFFVGVAILLPAIWLRLYVRLKYLQKLILINTLRRQQINENIVLYSTQILKQCCKELYFNKNRLYKKALRYLLIGKTSSAADAIVEDNYFLGILLEAHHNAPKAYKKMLKNRKNWLKNPKYGVYLPIMAYLCRDVKNFLTFIQKLSVRQHKSALAYQQYIIAYAYLNEGDMLSASQSATKAQKYFEKKHYIFEEAMCRLALAEIYRISCIEDIAQTMLETAIKTFKQHNLASHLAKTTVMLGMLMLFENRRDEAEQQYLKALNLAPTKHLKADVYNQLTLLYIAENKPKMAKKYLRNALALLKQTKDDHSLAFGLQLQGQIAYGLQQYKTAQKHLKQSLSLYQKQNNFSAVAECLYLMAESDYALSMFTGAERKLRLILEICRQYNNNFHSANAYSLLGLIYIKTNDWQRAKVLFQQSLRLEQKHERCEGIVADYANLALIEQISGNYATAKKNLQTAIEFANQSGDENLQKIIQQKLKIMT